MTAHGRAHGKRAGGQDGRGRGGRRERRLPRHQLGAAQGRASVAARLPATGKCLIHIEAAVLSPQQRLSVGARSLGPPPAVRPEGPENQETGSRSQARPQNLSTKSPVLANEMFEKQEAEWRAGDGIESAPHHCRSYQTVWALAPSRRRPEGRERRASVDHGASCTRSKAFRRRRKCRRSPRRGRC